MMTSRLHKIEILVGSYTKIQCDFNINPPNYTPQPKIQMFLVLILSFGRVKILSYNAIHHMVNIWYALHKSNVDATMENVPILFLQEVISAVLYRSVRGNLWVEILYLNNRKNNILRIYFITRESELI